MLQRPKLGEIVLRAGIVDALQLEAALGDQKKWGGRLGQTLIKLGFLTEADLVRALASQLNLPVASLDGKKIPKSVLALVPYDFADDHTCLPLFVKEVAGQDTLYLATDDPSNLDLLDDLAFRTGLVVKPVVVAASEICEGIDRFYRDRTAGPKAAADSIPVREWQGAQLVDSRDTTPFDEESLRNEIAEPQVQPEPEADLDSDTEIELTGALEKPELDSESDEPSTRLILHALTQIMIEKGVMTRDEFYQRVQRLRGIGDL